MVRWTHYRGRADTLPGGGGCDMWGLRAVSLRPLLWALLLALLVHGPLLPTALSGWLRWFFRATATEQAPDSGQAVVIPVELDVGIADDQAIAAPAAVPAPPDVSPPETSGGDEQELEHMFDDDDPDAGADATDAGANATVPDAGAPDAGEGGALDGGADGGPVDAGPVDVAESEQPDAGPPPDAQARVRDPYSEAGGAAAVGAEHPNVRIYLAADVLRRRPALAERFGALLAAIPQWSVLLGGTAINPIRDFDHILISGPQMRNPRWIVVALDYNLPAAAMKRAIDGVVRRSGPGGRWRHIDGLAVAQVGREAERRVVHLPAKHMLVVLPAEAEDQIPNTKSPKFQFKKSTGAGLVLYVITPWRAFAGSTFRMPKSMRWMRLKFSLAGSSGFVVEVEGQDGSEALAREHFAELKRQVAALPSFGPLRAFDKPTWEQHGDRIVARAAVSDFQLKLILGFAKKLVTDITARAARRKRGRARAHRAATAPRLRLPRPATSASAHRP